MLVLFIISTVGLIVQPFLDDLPYGVPETSRAVIPQRNEQLGKLLKYDTKEAKYLYNDGYSAATSGAKQGSGTPRYTANFAQDPTKGMTVTDPVNNVNFGLKPKFRLGVGKQDQNQLVYRLEKAHGYLVYTNQTASVKEDILLLSPGRDKMIFDYELDLGDGLEAKLEKDGSIGIYGTSLPLYGNVSTGTDQDAELLQKARTNAPKTKFLFGIPAPYVKEAGKKESSVGVRYELNDKKVQVIAEGLKAASYPLSIDPSIFVQSAAELMRGNNESNVEFDVATEQFKKGTTTGARIDEWTETGVMNDAVYDQGTVATGGYIYSAGGRTGRVMPWVASSTESKQDTTSTTFTMNMPNPRPSGDLYMAIIARDGTGAITAPACACWTQLASTREHAVYWHTGGGSEPASYNWTVAAGVLWAGTILQIKNAAVSPTFTTATQNNAGDVNPGFPTITTSASPTGQGALILRSASWDDDPVDAHGYAATGTDEIASGMNDVIGGVSYAVSRIDSPPAASTATGTATLPTTQNVLDSYGSSTIAIYGTAASSAYNQTLQWAHFNSSTGAIDSPAPGSDGTPCANWCTNTAYNLPSGGTTSLGVGNVGASMVAYNGYLYMIGGYDGTNLKSTVYISKLGSNGEPSLWHPTDPDRLNWTYWHKDTGINGSARAHTAAYAYNGKMYVVGGRTSMSGASPAAVSNVDVADILPNGTLGSWSAGPTLPANASRYGAAVQAYNGYLYAMGGNNGTSAYSDVYFSKINADGSLNTWQTALSFTTGRTSLGGTMSGIWGAYIYIAGGCTALNTTGVGNCTTVGSDVQLASINADGSLDVWNTMANLKQTRFGSSFIAWQDNLYRFGGCSQQDNTAGGDCNATHIDIQYGNINQDGDASTVSVTQATGAGNCVGNDPYDCNLPPGGTGSGQAGQALSASLILNGFLYSIGGCTTAACTTMTGNTAYVGISSDGRLKQPPSCAGGTYGSWCVDDTNQIAGGVGAAGVAVFGGRLYLVGGQNGSAGVNRIYRNSVNADGSLAGAWTAQNLSSSAGTPHVGATNVSYTYAYARASPSTASTVPGHLYIFGGCNGPASGAGCTSNAQTDEVYKCRILASGAIDNTTGTVCTKTGQLQIGTVTGASAAGLGVHAGTVYANYIYLIGGLAPDRLDLPLVRYAKFDNNNDVVAASGSAWVESSVEMEHGRRRGTAFGYNGYIYAVGGYDAASTQILDTIEYVKINVSDGSLINPGNGKFTQSAVTFNQRWGLGLAVSNSFAYIIGGCKVGDSPNCTTLDPTVQTFQIYNNDSGAPAGYSVAANQYGTDIDRIGASAAVYNGYMYIAGGCTTTANDCSAGTPATTASVMYTQLDAYGAPGTWQTGGSLPVAALAWGQLEVAGGTLYYIGGQTGLDTSAVSTVYYTTGISSGNPTWNGSAASGGIGDTSGQAAQARTHFSSTVWNNRIYVVGGYNGSAVQSTVYISPQLNSGGNIAADSWTSTTAINVARSGLTVISYANNLYILGGYDGTSYLSDVQFGQIASNGTISSWTYSTNLPFALRQADGFASNGYMYIFGGRTSTNDCTARTLIAPISANTTIASGNNPTGIGEWYQTNRSFDGGRYGVSAVNSQGKAYVLGGGCQGIVMQDDFDSALDGAQWTSTTGMTVGTTCQSTSSSNVLYTNDGATGATAAITKDVSVTSGGTLYFKFFSPNADGGGCYAREANFLGGNPDNVVLRYSNNAGGSWTTLATYAYNGNYEPMGRLAVTIPSIAGNTRFQWYMPTGEANDSFSIEDVYIVATGNTSIAYATASRVSYTALLSQPQVAIYSRLVDAGKDVTPTVFLMNGLDNSIGARWQMSYRSMNDPTVATGPNACGGTAMTGYGALTSFGDVTLGTPGAYTPKNSAGSSIGCSRYFFMTVSIDASQTFGYPEDINRGPTLDNLALFFNSNPGQRLIHGKTFLEGTQQPLDTPCRQSNPLGGACPLP